MSQSTTFAAPWGALLSVMTGLATLILVGVPLLISFSTPPAGPLQWIIAIALPAILIASVFFIIRGYTLTADALLVERPGWHYTIPLANLVAVEADPRAMSGSIRAFGNGGLFCFAGAYRNKRLGPYRVFATDPRRAVVLRFTNRTIVITPDDPAAFVAQVRALRGL